MAPAQRRVTSFGAKLQEFLETMQITQASLARRLGTSPQFVHQLVTGRRAATAATVQRVATALGVKSHYFPVQRANGQAGGAGTSLRLAMVEVDLAALSLSMRALRDARRILLAQPIDELLRTGTGKGDSLLLDSIPEHVITDVLQRFSDDVVLLTEERGLQGDPSRFHAGVFMIDPFDRSRPFAAALRRWTEKGEANRRRHRLFDVVSDLAPEMGQVVTAPVGAITFHRNGQLRFTVLVAFLAGVILVACPAFVKMGDVEACGSPFELEAEGYDVRFEPRDGEGCVYFIGEGETARQREQLAERLRVEAPPGAERSPGGPARILCLASPAREMADRLGTMDNVAAVASLGEKILEWAPWLAVALHSRTIAAYELFPEGPFARDGVLLAPSPNYSALVGKEQPSLLNMERLLRFDDPTRYRGCIVLTHIESDMRSRLSSLPYARELLPKGDQVQSWV